MNGVFQLFSIGANVWLSAWSNDDSSADGVPMERSQRDLYLGVYGALGLGQGKSFLSVVIINRFFFF